MKILQLLYLSRNPASDEKQASVVPNLDSQENGGNEADEELSISPTGNPNLSDLDSNNDPQNGTDNESELYFVCSPPTSTGGHTPKRFGTTTAFPISNNLPSNGLRRTEFAFDPHNLSDIHYNLNLQNQSHSNHLTIYSNRPTNLTPSPTGSRETTTKNMSTHSLTHVPYTRPRAAPPPPQHDEVPRPRPNSNSDDPDHVYDEDGFTYGGYDIQLNLRNSIKPSTALINKISTLSSNLNQNHPDHNFNTTYSSVHPRELNYIVETSSEEDASSIWYEYGCV